MPEDISKNPASIQPSVAHTGLPASQPTGHQPDESAATQAGSGPATDAGSSASASTDQTTGQRYEGDDNRDRDRDRDRNRRGDNDGPPDLEEVFENFLNKIKEGMQDKKSRKKNNGGNGKKPSGSGGGLPFDISLRAVLLILLAAWGAFGFFTVDEREQAVILQFGEYSETVGPGLHWVPLGIQTYEKVNLTAVRSLTTRATLLTGDENIISLEYEIQFVIADIEDYLFNVRDPDSTVRDVIESSVREIVGVNTLDYLLTEGRSFVGDKSSELGQSIIDDYQLGVSLQNVNIISAQPPDQVQSAFSDANKAREDEQRYINEAEVYKNEIIPKARGQSRKLTEEAKAYRFRVIESAKGETERFNKLYKEYRKAPDITRERLYLETMEGIMQRSNKIFIDAQDSKPFLYIPSPTGERRPVDSFSGPDSTGVRIPVSEELLSR